MANTPSAQNVQPRAVALWLFSVAALIFVMVLVGGATRLTESGLSIVEWAPVTGTLPPLTDAEWQAEFEKYQTSPEFQQINSWMTLDDFKTIYWWEFFHRLLGRLIGVAFLLPLLWFLWRRAIPDGFKLPLLGLFVLGGLQGALGWYMVQSGLVDIPEVSHFRLAAHLTLAVVIYLACIEVGVRLLRGRPHMDRFAIFLLGFGLLQVVLGALVAGLDAALAATDWPLMNGQLIPDDLGQGPLFSHAITVQFLHRMVAYGLAIAVGVFVWQRRGHRPALLVLLAFALQFLLGVVTLMLTAEHVPVWIGVAHQGGAVVLLTAVLWATLNGMKKPAGQSL